MQILMMSTIVAVALAQQPLSIPNAPSAVMQPLNLEHSTMPTPKEHVPAPQGAGVSHIVDSTFIIDHSVLAAALILDVEGTMYAQSRGGLKYNPLIGPSPSRLQLYAIVGATWASVFWLDRKLKQRAARRGNSADVRPNPYWRGIPYFVAMPHFTFAFGNFYDHEYESTPRPFFPKYTLSAK